MFDYKKIKNMIPYLIINLALYMLPCYFFSFLFKNEILSMLAFKEYFIFKLLVLNPIEVFLINAFFSRKFGKNLIMPILSGLIFLIPEFVIYNDSADIYIFYYMIVGVIAILLFNKKR